ncbi:hypothetical protein RvY_19560, partial [Ramazzottius varieornatus]
SFAFEASLRSLCYGSSQRSRYHSHGIGQPAICRTTSMVPASRSPSCRSCTFI